MKKSWICPNCNLQYSKETRKCYKCKFAYKKKEWKKLWESST